MERLKTSPGQGIEDGRLNGILEDPGTGKKNECETEERGRHDKSGVRGKRINLHMN